MVAQTLRFLSETNERMDLHEEGIKLVEEASQICKRLGDVMGEAQCLASLGSLLESTKQLDAAEEAASRAINLFSKNGIQFEVCQGHDLLGHIYQSKGETEKAIYHFEEALAIADAFNWNDLLFVVHFSLMELFLDERMLVDAQVHVEHAKSYAVNNTYRLGLTTEKQAKLWYIQGRLEESEAEVLRAIDMFEKVGAARELKRCEGHLWRIEEEMNKRVNKRVSKRVIPGQWDDGELSPKS